MKRFFAVALVVAVVATLAWLLTHRGAGTHIVSGTIETDEVRVASRYGGRVVKIHAQEGDQLQAGQLLVELDAAELSARRDQAAAQLEELEHGPRAEEIAAAKAGWESLQAQLEFAQAEDRRAKELFEAKTVSASERDQATSRARQLEKSVAAAEQQYALLKAGTRPEQIAQARARLAELDAQLREMKIVAPSESVLEVLNVKVGDVLTTDRPVATLLLTQHLWVRVFVPEQWLAQIQLGQNVDVHTDAANDKFTGTVEQINRQAEFAPRNVQTVEERIRQMFGIKVRLPADTEKLRAGMSADVSFPNVPPVPK